MTIWVSRIFQLQIFWPPKEFLLHQGSSAIQDLLHFFFCKNSMHRSPTVYSFFPVRYFGHKKIIYRQLVLYLLSLSANHQFSYLPRTRSPLIHAIVWKTLIFWILFFSSSTFCPWYITVEQRFTFTTWILSQLLFIFFPGIIPCEWDSAFWLRAIFQKTSMSFQIWKKIGE